MRSLISTCLAHGREKCMWHVYLSKASATCNMQLHVNKAWGIIIIGMTGGRADIGMWGPHGRLEGRQRGVLSGEYKEHWRKKVAISSLLPLSSTSSSSIQRKKNRHEESVALPRHTERACATRLPATGKRERKRLKTPIVTCSREVKKNWASLLPNNVGRRRGFFSGIIWWTGMVPYIWSPVDRHTLRRHLPFCRKYAATSLFFFFSLYRATYRTYRACTCAPVTPGGILARKKGSCAHTLNVQLALRTQICCRLLRAHVFCRLYLDWPLRLNIRCWAEAGEGRSPVIGWKYNLGRRALTVQGPYVACLLSASLPLLLGQNLSVERWDSTVARAAEQAWGLWTSTWQYVGLLSGMMGDYETMWKLSQHQATYSLSLTKLLHSALACLCFCLLF